jgi:hypothetical protein
MRWTTAKDALSHAEDVLMNAKEWPEVVEEVNYDKPST